MAGNFQLKTFGIFGYVFTNDLGFLGSFGTFGKVFGDATKRSPNLFFDD